MGCNKTDCKYWYLQFCSIVKQIVKLVFMTTNSIFTNLANVPELVFMTVNSIFHKFGQCTRNSIFHKFSQMYPNRCPIWVHPLIKYTGPLQYYTVFPFGDEINNLLQRQLGIVCIFSNTFKVAFKPLCSHIRSPRPHCTNPQIVGCWIVLSPLICI